jgi:hypothetical protein
MDTTFELKTLIWDVNESQTDLIKLGDEAFKQTGSFASWVDFLNRLTKFHWLPDYFDSVGRKVY